MQGRFITREGNSRLILIFAGWAMDSRPFAGLRRNGYDIAVLWDYRDTGYDFSFTAGYDEVCVLAWSFGVKVADMLMHKVHGLTRSVAINGSWMPVDDSRGIPADMFEATRRSLAPASLVRFYRRMAGGAKAMQAFAANMPQRDIVELADELDAVAALTSGDCPKADWDYVLVSRGDAVFPPDNLRRAWQGSPVREIDGPHLPDFQAVLNHFVIDKNLSAERFGRRRASYDAQADFQTAVVERLADIAAEHSLDSAILPGDVLEIGVGTAALTRRLIQWPSVAAAPALQLWDIAPADLPESVQDCFCQCDAEIAIRVCRGLGMMASASTVQWFNSFRRFIDNAADALADGAYLLCSTFARGNLAEVYKATGHGLPLYDAAEIRDILGRRFDIIAFEDLTERKLFDTPLSLFRHLQATGVNSLAAEGAGLRRCFDALPRDGEGKCTLSYHAICFLVRKKC